MLRARLPIAVATVAVGVALIPAATANAATPLDGTPLGSVLGQLQDGLSNASGSGSGSAPDVQGSLTGFVTCLQAAPNATASPSASASATTTPSATTSTPATGGLPSLPLNKAQAKASPDAEPTALTTQAAVSDPLSPILTAGQKCVENLFAGLGATQAQCFSANNFTASYLSEQVQKLLSGSTPDAAQFQSNLTGLLTCLTGGGTPTETDAPATVDSESATPEPTVVVGTEAPAAVAVTGTPNFTG